MESKYDRHVKTSVEELLVEIENLQRSHRKLVLMAWDIVEAVRVYQQMDPESDEWEEFGQDWSDLFYGWEERAETHIRQLEGCLWRLIALLPPHVQPQDS